MRRVIALCVLLLCIATFSFAITPADNGKWISTGTLLAGRQGAAAVALPDGRLLVTGGRGSDGSVLASTEIIQADGTAVAGPVMSAPRAGHSATLLTTGNVLIVGGDSGAGATVTAELFDPNTNVFTALTATLSDARMSHVAALDAYGNVTIIGGTTTNGPVMSVESFDTNAQRFVSIGRMMYSRSQPAIAAFKDGRVLIAGGVDVNGVTLASTEIFDPTAAASAAGPTMNVARAGATATLQIDGNIIVIGGTTADAQGNATEVASGELFAADGTSTFISTVLNVARTGHAAFLLPQNAGVLVVGGQAAGADLNTAELYQPWTGTATLSTMAATHAGGAGAAKPGVMAVAGGANQFGIELFGFPTLFTDKLDYAPGESVWMQGAGWLPGEPVSLYMQAIPSTANVSPVITTTADAAGNISDGTWAPDTTDINARFYLTAVGSASAWQAQTTFTDASPWIKVTVVGPTGCGTVSSQDGHINGCAASPNPGTLCQYQYSANFSTTLTRTATNGCTFTGWSGGCTGTATTCAASAGGNGTFAVTATFAGVAPSITSANNATFTVGSAGSFTVTASGAPTPISFSETGALPSGVTLSSAGVLSGIPALGTTGTYNITITAADGVAPNATQSFTLTVAQVTPTLSWTTAPPASSTYGAQFTVAATSNSTGAITYSTSGACSNNGATVTMTSSTTNCTVTATVAADANYSGRTLSGTVIAGKANLTITASSPTVNYGDAVPTITPSFTGFVNGETSSVLTAQPSCSTTYTTTSNAGSAPITSCSGATATNYSFSYVGGSVTVNKRNASVTPNPASKTYGAADPTLGGSLNGFLPADNVTATYSRTAGETVSGSPYTISATLSPVGVLGNYNITYNTAQFTVTPATLTVRAIDHSITYGNPAPPLNYQITGFVNGDTQAVVTGAPNLSFTYGYTSPVGDYPITVAQGTLAAANYTFALVNGTLQVSPGYLVVTADNKSKTYDGAVYAPFTVSYSGFMNNETASVLGGSLTFTGSAVGASNAGSYIITPSGLTATNYTISYNSGTLTITPASVEASAGSYSGTYDGLAHSPSVCTISGAYTAGLSCVNNPASVGPNVGQGWISPFVSGPTSNFSISIGHGQWTITQAPANIVLGNLTQTYDGSPKSVSVIAMTSNIVVAYTDSNNQPVTAPINPGSYAVTATSVDPNYFGTASGTLTINQLNPNLNLALPNGMPIETVYGTRVYFDLSMATTPCPTGQVQFYVDGEVASTSTLTGTNCTQPVEFQTATLTPGPHTIYAVYSGDTYYTAQNSGSLTQTVDVAGTSVILGTTQNTVNVGDSVTFTATVSPTTTADGSAQAPSGTVQFLDSGNPIGSGTLSATAPYVATYTTSSLVAGPHNITATYTSADSLYSGSSSVVTVETVNKLVPVINWTPTTKLTYGTALDSALLNASATYSGSTVPGTFSYDVTTGTVPAVGQRNVTATFNPTDAATYASPTATVTFTVTPGTLTVTADDQSRAYGAANPTFTYQITGFVNNEAQSVVNGAPSVTTTAGAKSPAGKYPITVDVSGLTAANYTFISADGNLSITPATLSIMADDKSKVYDGAAYSPFTASYSGFLNDDNAASLSGTLTFGGSAATATNAGSYSITPAGLTSTNYEISYKSGTLTINAAPVTATAGSYTGTYDGSAHAIPACTLANTVNGYVAGLSCSNSVTSAGPDVSIGTVTPSVTGANANFAITPVNGSYSISQASSSVSLTCPTSVAYAGVAVQPCTASVSGAGGLSQPVTVSYTNNNAIGTATATASYAGDTNHTASTASKTFLITSNTPVITPGFGTFTAPTTITISDGTPGVTIYYTTDGSIPTISSPNHCTSPCSVTVSVSETINAMAAGGGYPPSTVVSANFVVAAMTPVITPGFGTFTAPTTVTISDATAGVTIYYTTDGSMPTVSSPNHCASPCSVTVSTSGTISAIAAGGSYGMSAVASASYAVVAATPALTPSFGTYTSPISVSITDATAGVTIYYTTDGSAPTTSSPNQCTSPCTVAVSNTKTINAIAAGGSYGASAVASATYVFVAATPAITPGYGTFSGPQQVTISDTTTGAMIYYTTDGSTPTTSSPNSCASPCTFTVSGAGTVKAIAAGGGYSASAVASASYVFVAATPAITPGYGTFSGPQQVKITDATAGVTIYYTTDGSIPTTSSQACASPCTFTISGAGTVRAIAAGGGYNASGVASATYAFVTATPAITPGYGTFSGPQQVKITDTTAGATIYYTTDGSTPTTSSPNACVSPCTFTVSSAGTVRAIAAASGYNVSGVASATYAFVAATPVITPGFGTYTGPKQVSITDTTAGVTIYYTTDGSTPTTSSPNQCASSPCTLTLTKSATVKAIAAGGSYGVSSVASASLVIK